jgi:hypothetical protein
VGLVGIGARSLLQSILAVDSLAIQGSLTIFEDRYREKEKAELKGREGELATLKAQSVSHAGR